MSVRGEIEQLLAVNYAALDRADTAEETPCYTDDIISITPGGRSEGIREVTAYSQQRATAAAAGRRSIHVITNLRIIVDDPQEPEFAYLLSNYHGGAPHPGQSRVIVARIIDHARRIDGALRICRREAEVLVSMEAQETAMNPGWTRLPTN